MAWIQWTPISASDILADERDYGVGAQILRELGVHKMRLLTNNPVKRVGLEAYGLEIVENVPVETTPNRYNERYLTNKERTYGAYSYILISKLTFCFIISEKIAYFAIRFALNNH